MNPLHRFGTLALLCLGSGLGLSQAVQADGAGLVQERCAGCHALTAPAGDLAERTARKAPPLHYAGNKFRREWLVGWLQQPERIRPAGTFPATHTVSTPDGDAIDGNSLPAHPALGRAEAEAAADYLMTLRAGDALAAAEPWEPGTIALRMGQMNFGKFKGCDGCHQDAPGYGGVSGPELYTAWHRLQPAFMASYIGNPVAWDAHTMMPHTVMNATEVHKLANYLKVLTEETP